MWYELAAALVCALAAGGFATSWLRTRRRLLESQEEQRALERSSQVLEEERRVLDLVARGASLQEVLDSLTGAIERIEPDCLCSILLLDEQKRHLREGSTGSLPAEFMRTVNGLPIGPDVGCCGSAAFRNETVISEDIANDYRWATVKDFVVGQGLRACWSVPIRDSSKSVLGTFAMYHRRPAKPSQRELRLVEAGAHLAGNAIERLTAEQKMNQNAERMDLAEQAASFGIWELDFQSQTVSISKGLAAMMEQPGTPQLTIAELNALIHPDDLGHTRSALLNAIANGTPYLAEFRTLLPSGKIRWHRSQARVQFASGQPKRLTGAVTDVTEAKELLTGLEQARTAAEAANRAKSEFLANMSHEIRTPMNGILGMTEIALEGELSEEQRENLTTVAASANSLLSIVNDILDFSKIEAGKLEVNPVRFNVRDLMEDTLRAAAVRAHGKGLELVCDVKPGVPDCVVGDPTRVRQIVTNLIGNAIKFTQHGEVILAVILEESDPDQLRLHFVIEDTGIGIAPDKLGLIFAPFSQADGSTTRVYGGTGLGLTISKRLAEAMSGKLWVESDVGRGSRFHFTAFFGISAAQAQPEPESDARFAGVSVLIVDDSRANRAALAHMLGQWGIDPAQAASGEEALLRLRAGSVFSVALIDGGLPRMSGFELAASIEESQRIPVIMMLTSTEQRSAGPRLTKPVRRDELRRAIASAVKIGHRHDRSATPVARDAPYHPKNSSDRR